MKIRRAVLALTTTVAVMSAPAPALAYADGAIAITAKPTPRPAPRASRAAVRSWGVPASSWTGKGYSDRWEWTRGCIVKRESMGQYSVINRGSGAAGAYQFLLSTSNHVARLMGRRDLVGTRANHWSRMDQDRAFWTLWANGRGRGHWAGGRWSCGF